MDTQLLQSTDFAYLIGYLKITFHWPEKLSYVAVFETIEYDLYRCLNCVAV